jgi:predicted TIM-barrel fold metal-dependent hydrolase
MAKKGFNVLDSDMHVIEPPDLWQRYIDPEFKSRAPAGPAETVRDLRLVDPSGKAWGSNPHRDRDSRMDRPLGHSVTNVREIYKDYHARGWSGEVQLDAMDVEGIDAAVLYPTRGLGALSKPEIEPRFAAAIARAYNDWMYDFCAPNRERLLGAGMISLFDIEDAVAEARRCAKDLGFRAVFLRTHLVKGRNWHDPYYEPLWSALEELDLPLGFHESGTAGVPYVGDRFEPIHMLTHAYSHPGEAMLGVGSFTLGGVLQRHPNLKVGFLESNCSWLPYILWRLDEHLEIYGDAWAPEIHTLPSELFKRQCFASCEPDETPIKYVIDFMGSDRIVFSTDFPHTDSRFPDSVAMFLELPISVEDKRKILWDNCAGYYRIKG